MISGLWGRDSFAHIEDRGEGGAEGLSIISSKGKAGLNSHLALFQAEVMGHDDSPTLGL